MIFAMAKVSKAVWKESQEVNSFLSYSDSLRWDRLKDQKVCSGEIMHGTMILKQRHMSLYCSLTDEERLLLLLKVRCCI